MLKLRYMAGGLLLMSGTAIYLIWRPGSLTLAPVCFSRLRDAIQWQPGEWILYTFPDACWYGALLCLLPPLRYPLKERVATIIGCMLAPVHEIFQYFRLVPGIFCIQDLLTYIVILIIYLIICLSYQKKRKC